MSSLANGAFGELRIGARLARRCSHGTRPTGCDQFCTAFADDGFRSFAKHGKRQNEGNAMSTKAAEHHKKASEHHTHAARHHGEAAKHYEGGLHEKAAHHAHTARGHATHARYHSEEAAKAHTEEHGKK
jgi:hypothetical protein